MIKQKTSTFDFPESPTAVWNAVTRNGDTEELGIAPMTDEEYAAARKKSLKDGSMLCRVTRREPGECFAYELNAHKFDIHWTARFTPRKGGGCRMTISEVYDFRPRATISYLMTLLFLNQGKQHKAFYSDIRTRLNQR